MKDLKRTVRTHGKVLGHRAGVNGKTLLPYWEARFQIYLPAYRWILDHCLQTELAELRVMTEKSKVVLLDYKTNSDLTNVEKPLSHANLIVKYLQGNSPFVSTHPLTVRCP